ncbi:TetR/AcrR family transcriptional regulator [Paenibacillus barcinonensis]|uniref:TetR family transcriptional regulator n=1 Tax=Paenibacillus barcinonensis TaxID=198119 RepID=A0A2V4VEX7_PAEBA|nr:TetR/AcrR family transcriptional regulator [Paenibacillus barcinonensis]PYE52296.1 TetR family transcriptional regulator [Paenibacillus barcinonensis]QKS59581.1 TetR/AcrR family transcriptional regulator [Paenibacillus barcinonensis]
MRENIGVARTKNALKAALLSLLHEKELREITITQITSAAGYARGSFYFHYQYKEELLDELIDDTIRGFTTSFKEPYERRRHEFNLMNISYPTVTIFEYIHKNASAFRLFFTRSNMGFQEKLAQAIQAIYIQDMELLFPAIPEHINRDIITHHHVYLLLSFIAFWIKSNFKYSPQYMTEQMLEIAKLNSVSHKNKPLET